METIEWSSAYSVGVEALDEQHKKIISMINLVLAYKKDKSFHEDVSDVLDQMTQYAKEHFKTEEELMKKAGYPELEQQEREHREYTLKTARLCMEAVRAGDKMYPGLCDFLGQWWLKHILDSDMKYKGKI